jgi:putative acetyltransferase
MVGSLGGLGGATVIDLWAGSGSFGIEALSRGADRAIFVERGREALACLEGNLATLGFEDRAQVVAGSVLSVLAAPPHAGGVGAADVVFCDPPYADDPWPELFALLGSVVDGDGLVVGHAERTIELPAGWAEVRRRDYGRARILIARPDVDDGPADELQIEAESPDQPAVTAVLHAHLAHTRAASPPEHVHALDLDGLVDPSVVFLVARIAGEVVGVGALRLLGDHRGELKSMHTVATARGRGVGRAMVEALVDQARARGLRWVGLETGTMDEFAPARDLYRSVGFTRCAPFGDYTDNPFSLCMGLDLA